MTEELKPCPFCGSDVEIIEDVYSPSSMANTISYYYITCKNPNDCMAHTFDELVWTQKNCLIEAWNKRS